MEWSTALTIIAGTYFFSAMPTAEILSRVRKAMNIGCSTPAKTRMNAYALAYLLTQVYGAICAGILFTFYSWQ